MSSNLSYDKEKLFEKTFDCPVCKSKFKSLQPKQGSIKVLERDTDLSATYADFNPTYYGVVLCEECGFAAFSSSFADLPFLELKEIENNVTSAWKKRDFPKVRTVDNAIAIHKIAYVNYITRKNKPSDAAKCALRISWFLREKGNNDESEKFQGEALKQYKKAYVEENLDLDPDYRTTVYYLIGELSRRQDDYNEAVKWYREAIISNRNGKNLKIERLAEDQMEVVRKKS